ncbi:hypothetical protein BSKO_04967 [Bryopsis sp. KO-2023]|nr:hypothetical protein BSKO_04967 [Bryopsis sp. KO-2023]
MSNLFGRSSKNYSDVEFWEEPERSGWLMKQGEYLKNWRRRWFVLKQGKIFWFKSDIVTSESVPRGVICVNNCLSIKGAEDTLNRQHAFEITIHPVDRMFFIADTEKEKEDWINSIGRAIVKHSRSLLEHDHSDYTTHK